MIIVDVETSGVDPIKHSLLSIGAVDFDDPKRLFYEECRIFPGAHVSSEALAINGFSSLEIDDPKKQTDEEIVRHFIEWAKKCKEFTLAGQNPSTDRDFLKYTAERYRINWAFAHRTLDLHSIAYYHHIERKICPPATHNHSALNLDAILCYVGIPPEPKPHIALNGARLEAEAFSRILENKPLFDEFKAFPIPWKGIGGRG